MVEYKCNQCNKLFKLKGDYTRHINRKTPCNINCKNLHVNLQKPACKNPIEEGKVQKINPLQCIFCGRTFTRKDNLNKHITERCKA